MVAAEGMDKRSLSERDIYTKFITPALHRAGWDDMRQIREEVTFTKGRITVRGKLVARGESKRADYILYYKPNIPIAVIEAKDDNPSVGDGMQQALDYAETRLPTMSSCIVQSANVLCRRPNHACRHSGRYRDPTSPAR